MPKTTVLLYQEEDGSVPVKEWLWQLSAKVRIKCLLRIGRLKELGHELRRPEADFLRDKIYELRIRGQHVNYRILYFFDHLGNAIISHGITKEKEVPYLEIKKALKRKIEFEKHPEKHTRISL